MKNLIIIVSMGLILTSCSTYRAYQKVAADPFVDARESILLSQKCLTVYPAIRDSVKVIHTGVDSSDYNAVNAAYNVLLDSLIAHAEREAVPGSPIIVINRQLDSLRYVRNFLKIYKPAAIVKTEIREVPVRNTAWEAKQQAEIEACRAENAQALMDKEKAEDKLQRKHSVQGWIIAAGLLLAILGFILGKITKKV